MVVTQRRWTIKYAAFHRSFPRPTPLAGGADVNFRGGFTGRSAIFASIQGGHPGILRVLPERGAHVDVMSGSQTPLHTAVEVNNAEKINVLVERGTNIEAQCSDGSSPLQWTVLNVNHEVLIALLKHDPNVNYRDACGYTPLHSAASKTGARGTVDNVDNLLRSGANEKMVINDAYLPGDGIWDNVSELENRLGDDHERVYKLLANAPANRAWRRRGCLILCRARPDRVELRQAIGNTHDGKSRRILHGPQLAGTEARGWSKELPLGCASGVDKRDGFEESGVVPKVVGLPEEGMIRIIVGFL